MSLAEVLFKDSGSIRTGSVYLDAVTGGDEAWATTQEVLAPTAYWSSVTPYLPMYQLFITRVVVTPNLAGAVCSVAIASFAESDTGSPTTIFDALFHQTDVAPVVLDLRDGPIPVTPNHRLLAKIATSAANHYAAVDITCVEVAKKILQPRSGA